MNQKPNKLGCYLVINTNDDDPNIITKLLSMNPSEINIKGKQKNNHLGRTIPNVFYDKNLWILKSGPLPSEPDIQLNHVIESFLDRFKDKYEILNKITNKYNRSYLFCYAYYNELNPCFSLSKELLSCILNLNLSIDFDLYCLSKNKSSS